MSDLQVMKDFDQGMEVKYPNLQAMLRRVYRQFKMMTEEEEMKKRKKFVTKEIKDIKEALRSKPDRFPTPIWKLKYDDISNSSIQAWSYTETLN